MLELAKLIYLYSEQEKIGYKCVGEVEGEKIYRIHYAQKSYYVTQNYTHLYTVYNNNPDDYEVELLDVGVSSVLKHYNSFYGE